MSPSVLSPRTSALQWLMDTLQPRTFPYLLPGLDLKPLLGLWLQLRPRTL